MCDLPYGVAPRESWIIFAIVLPVVLLRNILIPITVRHLEHEKKMYKASTSGSEFVESLGTAGE